MADPSDPQNYDRRLRNTLDRVRESDDVDEDSREAIIAVTEAHLDGRVPDDDQLATSSLDRYTNRLRLLVEEIDQPLPEADPDVLDEYLEELSYTHSASTHNATVSALRAFADYHDIDAWEDEFDLVKEERTEVDTSKLFSDEEVSALIDAAGVRGQTIVALLADTGCRIGALASFRIRDLDLEGDVPQLTFNTDAPTKSASGKVLLSWSVGHLETYLSTEHPRPDEPNAPVIHKKEQWANIDEDGGAVSTGRLRTVLRELGEEAGIPADRMKPHNFRHTAVSNWIRQGYNPSEIVHMASWASPEMLDIYDNVTDEQRNRDLAVKRGLVEDEDVVTSPEDATIPCPRCDTPVRRNANFCPKCSLQMSRAPALEDDADPVTLDESASSEPQPGVPDDLWADGAGDVLDEVPPEVLMQKLVEKSDVDVSDLVDE